VAKQVVDARAGVRLRFDRASADQIAEAVKTVLAEPSYQQAARRVAESFRSAGGANSAAEHLDQLASEAIGPKRLEGKTGAPAVPVGR
jgi:UDP:flavonoid glycosyltransferase YjiC (YdhE family)